jgi:hypothetical protein
MALNNALTINEAGLDQIVNCNRNRATIANPLGINYMLGIGTPVSLAPAGTQTLTAAQLGTGIVVLNPSVANTTTFDTAANIVAYFNSNSAGAVVGDILTCLIINGQSTNTLTLAAGSGGAYDTNQTAGSRIILGNSSKVVYIRLTNVTSGSEAYVVYS